MNKTTKSRKTYLNKGNLTLRMRAECATDAQLVRALFQPWLVGWQEAHTPTRVNGQTHLLPGAEVTLTLASDGPTHAEAVWLVDHIVDCHVVADTLMPLPQYTGERKFRSQFTAPARQPAPKVVEMAATALESRAETMTMEADRAAFSAESLLQHASGAGPALAATEGAGGWVFSLEHEATGLASVHAVQARSRDRDEPVFGRLQIELRALTKTA